MENSDIQQPKLYALLVGINAYDESVLLADKKVRFPRLNGCVSDVGRIKDYLIGETCFKPFIKTVTDRAATKQEIVTLFKDHLGKAEKDDIVFFYFSGHGTQEHVDPSIFPSETDGTLESIACYYDEDNKTDFLLADKELRWLTHDLSQKNPHIVTIFDCCHSGDNTRNGYLVKNAFNDVIEKRIPFVFDHRNWNDFIFSKAFKKEELIEYGENKLLPEGKHFQLSACESDESAIEISGEGVFTKVLLQILNTVGGDITYHSLGGRTRQYMRNLYEQKPKLYIASEEHNDVFKNFLNKPLSETKNAFGEIVFNSHNGWQLNMGAIHGINKDMPALKIFEQGDPTKDFLASIGTVGIDSAAVSINGDPDPNKVYKAYIEGLTAETLRIHFASTGAELTDQAAIFKPLLGNAKQSIIAEEDEQKAQYVLRFLNGKYYLTYPDDPYRPLVKPVFAIEKEVASKISSDINHIANWEFLKNLTSPDQVSTLSQDSLKVEIAIGNGNYKTFNNNEAVNLDYSIQHGKWKNSIRVQLTNNSGENLYCCVLYLISNFSSYSKYLNPAVKMLKPGESIELKTGNQAVIPIGLDQGMKWYNWKEQEDYFKFIISTTDFDASLLDFKSLAAPDVPIRSRNRHAINDYTDDTFDFDKNTSWLTKQVALILKNPEYNTIRENDLKLMLDDPKTADFALGLYFDAVNEGFNQKYKLKSDIQIKGETTRGIVGDVVIDLANWWSRRKRNQFYNEALSRFPNRIKIVSEGDSWFQHPLVLDIIDHLHRVYNIYCVSAAADTLRNYFSEENSNGEYYMNALDEKNPEFLLISGGGNDILGSQFRSYLLNEHPNGVPEGENPERFLKEELFNEIESLMEIYKSAFNHLMIHKPGLHIIVHGYDYPVKLNDTKKGWLGRYMIEKGINRPGDRKAIIHLIMDTFNQKLSEISKEFDNVTYLDVRDMVRYDEKNGVDQWYDEIHPDNNGFQQIAMKFMQTIDGVVANKR